MQSYKTVGISRFPSERHSEKKKLNITGMNFVDLNIMYSVLPFYTYIIIICSSAII